MRLFDFAESGFIFVVTSCFAKNLVRQETVGRRVGCVEETWRIRGGDLEETWAGRVLRKFIWESLSKKVFSRKSVCFCDYVEIVFRGHAGSVSWI